MTDLVDPVVLGYRIDPGEGMDRLCLFLPDGWTMVLLRPYGEELLAQVRAENEVADLDYVVVFNRSDGREFWLYNCVEGLGLGYDDDGDPFLQLQFEDDLAEEEVFASTDFYVGFQDKAHTYELFDQLVNLLDPAATAPLPQGLTNDNAVDPETHPNAADARAHRVAEGFA